MYVLLDYSFADSFVLQLFRSWHLFKALYNHFELVRFVDVHLDLSECLVEFVEALSLELFDFNALQKIAGPVVVLELFVQVDIVHVSLDKHLLYSL